MLIAKVHKNVATFLMWRLQVQRGRCKWRQLRATVCTAGKLVSSRPRPWRHGCTKWQEWSRTQWHTIETMKWQNHWMPLGHFRFVKGKALQTCSGTFRTWLQRSRIYKAQNLIWRHAVTSSFAKRLDVFIDLKQLWRACDLLVSRESFDNFYVKSWTIQLSFQLAVCQVPWQQQTSYAFLLQGHCVTALPVFPFPNLVGRLVLPSCI